MYTYLCFSITNYFPYQSRDQLYEEEKEQIAQAEEAKKALEVQKSQPAAPV